MLLLNHTNAVQQETLEMINESVKNFEDNKTNFCSYAIEGTEYVVSQDPYLNNLGTHQVVYEVMAVDIEGNTVTLAWDVTEWHNDPDSSDDWQGDWDKEVFIRRDY